MSTQPRTVWEDGDGLSAGMQVVVRGAGFPLGPEDQLHGAVTVTFRVPEGFFMAFQEGDASATALLTPNEARGVAAWLDEAAAAADRVGPPLYE